MKKEDLRETKIYLSNVEDRVKFQEKMFSLGIKWNDSTEDPSFLDSPFYYIGDDIHLTHSSKEDLVDFEADEYKQIFLHDVLSIKETNKVCEFKPFDKVLVRDSNDTRWKPRLFARHSVEYNGDYPFETTGGGSYRYCIPYNEDLANTTKNI